MVSKNSIQRRLNRFREDFQKAVQYSVSTWSLRVSVVLVSVLSFLLFVLLTFPQYSIELLLSGVENWGYLLTSLLWLINQTTGYVGLSLLSVYSILTGVLVTVVIGSIRYNLKRSSGSLLAVLPAIIFSGCASCGAGILGIIGLYGYATLFPFGGNLVRLVGILFVIIAVGWLGDPRECAV